MDGDFTNLPITQEVDDELLRHVLGAGFLPGNTPLHFWCLFTSRSGHGEMLFLLTLAFYKCVCKSASLLLFYYFIHHQTVDKKNLTKLS